VAFHLTNSIAFAHILPVSLAFFAKLAPATINSTILDLYYLALFAANTLVGWVGALNESCRHPDSGCFTPRSPSAPPWVFLLFKVFLGPYLLTGASERAKLTRLI